MRKIIIFLLLILLIPCLIVKKYEVNKFYFNKNQMIRVKYEDGSIDSMPLEKYLIGVIAGEVPLSFDKEALKAQAVASRTYALKKIEENVNNDYDVVSTVMNQVYLNDEYLQDKWQDDYDNNINLIEEVIDETKGQYLVYNDSVIDALFFSTSSGLTENSEEVFSTKLPYLRSVESSFDSEVSPIYEETKIFTKDEFKQKLNISGSVNIEIISTTSTGRIKKIKINDKIYDASEIVNILDLKSSYFSITEDENNYVVTTKGYGHGVGMSQYGAEALALKGYSYEEILKYYYTDVDIKSI